LKLLVAALFLALAAPPQIAIAAPTVDIPVILSLTGNAAFAGHDDAQVLSIFESYVNSTGGIRGEPLHFNVLDDQSSPQVAVQLMNAAMAKNPAVVLGPAVVATCNAVGPLIRNGPVVYCFSPSIDAAPGGFMFATATSSDSIMSAELTYARLKGYHRVAAIVTTDAAGQHNESAFRQIFALGIKDVQLVDVEHMQPASPSVTAQLVKIQAANPEVFFIYATGGDFGTVLRDMNALGLRLPVVTSGANQNATLLNQYKDVMPKALLSSGIPFTDIGAPKDVTAAMAAFTDAFRSAHVDPKSLNVTPGIPPAS
jgi:branched-chain amino acid transport system substrate-binding protein